VQWGFFTSLSYDFHVTTQPEFRRRILLVDGNASFRNSCADVLRRQGYEVLTADDGFGALCILRGATPDVLITELDLPRMSGFELLSIVRTRFPLISVIVVSGEYTPLTTPHEAVCDAFLAKGPNVEFELIQEIESLITESPIRGAKTKSDTAPVWIPRTGTGYILLTCPECLRSFPALEVKPGVADETCVFCGANVPFRMDSGEVPPMPQLSPRLQSTLTRAKARRTVSESRKLRKNIPPEAKT
jgi:CheY-like chemotaxis protein